ncbi:MAG: aspartate/glutamate racemase family protein [Sutterella wadsworthensis]|nr:aspartate/glutamate racemase family protein [Sutterella wadsworthensis]
MANILKVGLAAGINPVVAPFVKAALFRAAAEAGRTIELIEDETELRKDAPTERLALGDAKITALESVWRLQEKGCDVALIANLRCEAYLAEVQTEVQMPIVSLYAGLTEAVQASGAKKVGLVGCALPVEVLRRHLPDVEFVEGEKLDCLNTTDEAVVREEAQKLLAAGAEVLVPVCGRVAGAAVNLKAEGLPFVDILSLAAKKAVAETPARLPKPFKVGLIGGLGPAATVDLYDKIVKATPAKNDQEHFKLVVEQNPQIPDRTACLLKGGDDPTLAMYGCARRLQADGCDAVIIPCNTAHAFIPYLERHLGIPFINMQIATIEEIKAKFGDAARIGLLATSGTVQTGIYAEKAKALGLPMFVPDEEHQERVMAAIYGPVGAKAGFTTGQCRDDLVSAAEYLVKTYDCNCLILGCTELPLILDECDDFPCGGKTVSLIDPTSALARKVARVAQETNAERGTR